MQLRTKPDFQQHLFFAFSFLLTLAPNQQAAINTTSISQIQQYHLQHQQLRQQNLHAAMNHSTAENNVAKVDKKAKAKKELNKQSSSESITNKTLSKVETVSKCNGTSSPCSGAITATQKRKDKKLKSQLAKQSSVEDSSSVESVARSVKTKTKDAIPAACNKAKRNSIDVEPQAKLTKDLQFEIEAKKEERRKVKAPKYEYADPQYKTNKFDVLDMDDDDDYYISEEESVDSGVTTSTVENTVQQISKKIPTKVTVSNKNAKQSIHTPPPPSTAAKTEKSKPTKELPPQTKKEKSPIEAEVPLSKKQKKKLAQQQARQQSQGSAQSSVSKGDSLSSAMHKLRLNDDTTIELVKENHETAGCNAVRQ